MTGPQCYLSTIMKMDILRIAEAGKTKVLFVKNLSYDTDEDSLRQAFEGCTSARIATFQDSGKPRG